MKRFHLRKVLKILQIKIFRDIFLRNPFKRDPDSGKNKKVYHTFEDKTDTFPYLLVNIGSGVSIICIKNETEWERVGGTAMGGGTFWGLGIW